MALANGDISVQRSVLPDGEAGVDATVAKMVEMAKGQYGARSAKIRALAINIINAAKVADKDYFGMAKAIHEWVRDQIRYVRDPVGQETLSYPEETAFNTRAEDCDGKSILEMALLGSIGISSYPVVVGMQPGRYSHVYVYIVIPPGTGRYAGETIAADPIMREWPLGKEVPDSKVKAKKLYSELSGLGMNLGAYASGPDYLDSQNLDSVAPVLRSRMTDTGARGRIMNTAEITRPSDDLDDMFVRGSSTLMPFSQAKGYDLHQLGPVTARGAQLATSFLDEIRPQPLRERRSGPKIVTVQNKKTAPAVPKISSAPTLRELKGLGDYLAAIEPIVRKAAKRQTVSGKGDVLLKTAAVASIANQRARKATRRVVQMHRSIGMFGLGAEVDADDVKVAQSIADLAHTIADKAAAMAKASTGGASERVNALRVVFGIMERAEHVLGTTTRVEAMVGNTSAYPVQDTATKVNALTELLHNPEIADAANTRTSMIADAVDRGRSNASPLKNPLAPGSVVRDRNGEAIYASDEDGAAGLGFGFKSITKAVKKAVAPVVKVAEKIVPEAHLMSLTQKAIASVVKKTPLAKSSAVRSLLNIPKPKSSSSSPTSYVDANGKPITAAQYNAQMAQITAYNAAITAINNAINSGATVLPTLSAAQISAMQALDPATYQWWLQNGGGAAAAVPGAQIGFGAATGQPIYQTSAGGFAYANGTAASAADVAPWTGGALPGTTLTSPPVATSDPATAMGMGMSAAQQASYQSAISALQQAMNMGYKPPLTPDQIAVLQQFDPTSYQTYLSLTAGITPQSSVMQPYPTPSSVQSGMITGSSYPAPGSSYPVDSFGPDQMSAAYDQNGMPESGASATQTFTATGFDDPTGGDGAVDDGGDASEGTLYSDANGMPVDENGDPVQMQQAPQPAPAPVAAPAPAPASSGVMPLLAAAGALWWFGKKHH